MIGRLRDLAVRPIAESERRRMFALVAAILIGATAALLATDPRTAHDTRPDPPPPAVAASPAPRPRSSRSTTAVPDAAARSARRFLAGYLRWLYGHGRASEIHATAPALRRRLARSPLRVSPAALRRRPRITSLDGRHLPSGAVAITAEVADDGVARYPIQLRLSQASGRWSVVAVGGD